jgi:putative flavoprotein involved in K+ transport
VLSCGRAPWAPRRLNGVDIVTWLERTGFFDQPLSALPSSAARLAANVQATGAGGGHDLHCRVLQRIGVTLAGRLADVSGDRVTFADDLRDSVAFGDARLADVARLLRQTLGDAAPDVPVPEPFTDNGPTELDIAAFRAVIFTTGFRPDYARWVRFPIFDRDGFPITDGDLRTTVPGLHFCGVHFLRNRRSSLLWGVGDDARIVARTIASERRAA